MKYPLFSSGICEPFGCTVNGGELTPAFGVEKLTSAAPNGIICAGYSAGAGRYLFADGERVYVSANLNSFIDIAEQNAETPFFIEHISGNKTFSAIVKNGGAVAHCGEYFTTFPIGKNLTCGVMRCGRLFAADGATRVLWSGEGGVEDWEEKLYGAGYIDLDTAKGKVVDLINFGGSLAVVREYGVDFLRAFGTPENFVLEDGFSCVKIYGGTARVVSGKIYFCTEDGFKVYDGEVKSIRRGISRPQCAFSCGNVYFLACFVKDFNRLAVLCYDAESGLESFINVAPTCMFSALGKVCFCCGDGIYSLIKSKNYCVAVRKINFKNGKNKTLSGVYIGGNCKFTVKMGGKVRNFPSAQGLVKIRMRGKTFDINVEGNAPLKDAALITEEKIGI